MSDIFSRSYCFRPLKWYCVFSVMFIVWSNKVTVNPECLFCRTRPQCWLSMGAVNSLSGQMLRCYHTFPPPSHTHICSVVLTHFTMATILFHVLCVLLRRSERWAKKQPSVLYGPRRRGYILFLSLLYSLLLLCCSSPEAQRRTHFLPFLFLLCARNFCFPRVCCWVQLSNKSKLSVYLFFFFTDFWNEEHHSVWQTFSSSHLVVGSPQFPAEKYTSISKLLKEVIIFLMSSVPGRQKHEGISSSLDRLSCFFFPPSIHPALLFSSFPVTPQSQRS